MSPLAGFLTDGLLLIPKYRLYEAQKMQVLKAISLRYGQVIADWRLRIADCAQLLPPKKYFHFNNSETFRISKIPLFLTY
jgi:hypothetical protein